MSDIEDFLATVRATDGSSVQDRLVQWIRQRAIPLTYLGAALQRDQQDQRADFADALARVAAHWSLAPDTILQIALLMCQSGFAGQAGIFLRDALPRLPSEEAVAFCFRLVGNPGESSGLPEFVSEAHRAAEAYLNDHLNVFRPDQAYKLAGLIAMRQGRLEQALGYFGNAAHYAPTDRDLWAHLASLHALVGNAATVTFDLKMAEACRYVPTGLRRRRGGTSGTVLLISPRASFREKKIAYGLKYAGRKVVYLTQSTDEHDGSFFDDIIVCKEPQKALQIVRDVNPEITHALCRMYDFTLPAMCLADDHWPVIIDVYDHINLQFKPELIDNNPLLSKARTAEYFCIENAHGMVFRTLEAQTLRRHGHVTLDMPGIFFPDYGWGNTVRQSKLSAADGQLHVVYGGTICDELKRFIRVAAEQRFHFHLYIDHNADVYGESYETLIAPLVAVAGSSPYVHFYRPIYSADYHKVISQYDVMLNAIFLRSSEKIGITESRLRFGFSNKFADSVDSSLLYLVNRENMCNIFGKPFHMSMGFVDDDLDNPNFWAAVKAQCHNADFDKARRVWSITTQIPRLTALYDRVLTRHKPYRRLPVRFDV